MEKTPTSALRIGMRVVELDRPWLGTPFLFQGFLIRTEDELVLLRELCRYVYIQSDAAPEAPPAVAPRPRATTAPAGGKTAPEAAALRAAHAEYTSANAYVSAALEGAQRGEAPNIQTARIVVAGLVGQVLRSPAALIWLTQLKSRDAYTAQHSLNVAILALALGRSAGLSETDLHLLGLGALLHDIGKLRVPLEILNKPGRLSAEEFETMRAHPELGVALLNEREPLPPQVLEIVLHHHERGNGRGYPAQLPAERIPMFAKLVAIVDVYDALTSDRVYHEALSPHDVLRRMQTWTPEWLDASLMTYFLRTLGLYPAGTLVQMGSGDVGIVVSNEGEGSVKPLLMLILDSRQQPHPRPKYLNLASDLWGSATNVQGKPAPAPSIARVLPPGSFGLHAAGAARLDLAQRVDAAG